MNAIHGDGMYCYYCVCAMNHIIVQSVEGIKTNEYYDVEICMSDDVEKL